MMPEVEVVSKSYETRGEHVFSSEVLMTWVADLLTRLHVPSARARIVADSLVDAELCGLASHGLSRLGVYVKRLQHDLINAEAQLSTVAETTSALALDAGNGFGHPAAVEAIDRAIGKARLSGLCAVAIRNSTHFGRAGYFAERAARKGCVAIVTTNSAARMAPWGSKEAVFGTNPLAVGVPSDPDPVLLDMSTSSAALGKIVMAAKFGDPIPEGWALDRDGHPTSDAQSGLDGTLLPVGGPKGSGLAFILDLMSGVLSGAKFGTEVGSLYRDFTKPEGCGHFMIVLDVAAFMPLDFFQQCVAAYAAQIRATQPVSSQRPVLLPGELEQLQKEKSLAHGIVLSREVWQELAELSGAAGVDFPEPLKMQ